jgi:hypothetical protein
MKNKAYIYQPKKSAMQSGKKKSYWLITFFDACDDRFADSVMGWVSSFNTASQISFKFISKELAIAFAKQKGFCYEIIENKTIVIKPKSYSSNFTN